jgi:hypothetical protein
MTQELLIGFAALSAAVGLLLIALPNGRGESPHFLHVAPMIYPPVVLILFAMAAAR